MTENKEDKNDLNYYIRLSKKLNEFKETNKTANMETEKSFKSEKHKVYTSKFVSNTKGIADINPDFKLSGAGEFEIPSGKMR